MATTRHEIPTHLNVEDRAFFGLSVRQFTDLVAGLAGSYSLWHQVAGWPVAPRVAVTALSLTVALAVALFKPGGRRPEQWLIVWLHYAVTPRRAAWRPRRPDARDWRPTGRAWAQLNTQVLWHERRP